MDTIKHLEWRYATKKFDKTKKLSASKLNILKQAFNLTATSFGLQTISLLVVTNPDIRERLVEHTYRQLQVLDASHLLIICIKETIDSKDVNDYFDNVRDTRNTSETILSPYRKNLIETIERKTQNEQQQWSINQAHIALGNLMTVCAIEGIDSCPMEGFITHKYDDILNLKARGLKSVLLLPVGYRAEDDMFSGFLKVRKNIEHTIIEI